MNQVETIPFAHGMSAAIYYDADAEQPYLNDDGVRIVILSRTHIDPSAGECGRDPDEATAWAQENAADWFTIPLFLYEHGGVVYRVGHSNPFHCPWDSGRVGFVALKRAEWGNGDESDDWLAERAARIAGAYTKWANGECYGYVLRDRAGHEIDSCWGLIGIDSVREESAAAAAARDPGDVTENWGIRCPACGDCDEIDIAATLWVRLCPDGTDPQLAANGDHEWSDDHAACCNACSFVGKVCDFRTAEKGGAS